jgi:hypothetical protein
MAQRIASQNSALDAIPRTCPFPKKQDAENANWTQYIMDKYQ